MAFTTKYSAPWSCVRDATACAATGGVSERKLLFAKADSGWRSGGSTMCAVISRGVRFSTRNWQSRFTMFLPAICRIILWARLRFILVSNQRMVRIEAWRATFSAFVDWQIIYCQPMWLRPRASRCCCRKPVYGELRARWISCFSTVISMPGMRSRSAAKWPRLPEVLPKVMGPVFFARCFILTWPPSIPASCSRSPGILKMIRWELLYPPWRIFGRIV